MFLRKRKKKEKISNPDAKIHRVFQLGALVIIGVIVYNSYFFKGGEGQVYQCDEKTLDERAKAALEKMSENTEYKKLRSFVEYMDSNIDKTKSSVLDTPQGILIYVPNEMMNAEKNNIDVDAQNYKVNLSVIKMALPQKDEKPVQNEPEAAKKDASTVVPDNKN